MCNVLPQVRIYICLSDDNIWTWPPSRQFRCAASVTVAIEPGTSRATFVTLALGKTCLHNPLISLCSASLECGTDSGNIPEACCCLRATLSSFWTDRESRLHLQQPEDTGLHSTGPQLQEYYKKTVQKWRTATHLYWGFHQLSNRHNNVAAKVWTCICVLIFGGFYPTLTITFKTLVRIYVHLFKIKRKNECITGQKWRTYVDTITSSWFWLIRKQKTGKMTGCQGAREHGNGAGEKWVGEESDAMCLWVSQTHRAGMTHPKGEKLVGSHFTIPL